MNVLSSFAYTKEYITMRNKYRYVVCTVYTTCLPRRIYAISSVTEAKLISAFSFLSNPLLISCNEKLVAANARITDRSLMERASVWKIDCISGTYTSASCTAADTDTVVTSILF